MKAKNAMANSLFTKIFFSILSFLFWSQAHSAVALEYCWLPLNYNEVSTRYIRCIGNNFAILSRVAADSRIQPCHQFSSESRGTGLSMDFIRCIGANFGMLSEKLNLRLNSCNQTSGEPLLGYTHCISGNFSILEAHLNKPKKPSLGPVKPSTVSQ